MAKEILTFRGTVYPWQCDHMGHMNVMWYTSRFDEATWVFLGEYGLTRRRFEAEDFGTAALEQHYYYKRELHPGDCIAIFTKLTGVTDKIVDYSHRMVHEESGEDCAIMSMNAICLDRIRRKSRPFPPDIYERLKAGLMEGGERGSGF